MNRSRIRTKNCPDPQNYLHNVWRKELISKSHAVPGSLDKKRLFCLMNPGQMNFHAFFLLPCQRLIITCWNFTNSQNVYSENIQYIYSVNRYKTVTKRTSTLQNIYCTMYSIPRYQLVSTNFIPSTGI
jgi:hypothetical protein